MKGFVKLFILKPEAIQCNIVIVGMSQLERCVKTAKGKYSK
jgi:hypothetical protein